jgi:hypothetical protein
MSLTPPQSWTSRAQTNRFMGKVTRSQSVPKNMQARYDQIVALTDEFCHRHLNDEYRELAQFMAAALCRNRPSPVASGQMRSWACGIIYALGQVNFLSDKSFEPYMMLADVCAEFGVGQSTGSAKARTISGALKLGPAFDPEWTLPSMLDKNPLVWMAEGERLSGGPSHHVARGAGDRVRERPDPLHSR